MPATCSFPVSTTASGEATNPPPAWLGIPAWARRSRPRSHCTVTGRGRSPGPMTRKPNVSSRLAIGCGESPHSGQRTMYAAAAGAKPDPRQCEQQRRVVGRVTGVFFPGRPCPHAGHTRFMTGSCDRWSLSSKYTRWRPSPDRRGIVPALGAAVGPSWIRLARSRERLCRRDQRCAGHWATASLLKLPRSSSQRSASESSQAARRAARSTGAVPLSRGSKTGRGGTVADLVCGLLGIVV